MNTTTTPQNQMNSDSSGDEITTNYEGYSAYPMNNLQDPFQYPNQIPPQPIYPGPQNQYSQPVMQPQQPPLYPNSQPQYYPNSEPQQTFSEPPPIQTEIITNDIEKPMDTCTTVIQNIFIVYLFGYPIWDIIYQLVEIGGINIALVDDFLLMLLGVIILIYALRKKQPNSVLLCIYGFITWFIGFPFKIVGFAQYGNGSSFMIAMLLIRFVLVGIIFVYTCPPKIRVKFRSRRRRRRR